MDKEEQTEKERDAKELIALAAHDLKSILARIYGLNDFLLDKLNGHADPEFAELTGLISSQCKLGMDITAGLVLSYKQNIFSLNDLLAKQARLYKYQADRKNIKLSIELFDKDVYVQNQSELFIRVLDNLFDNAVKFTARHGSIKIALHQQDNKAIISVSDTGIGIPENFHTLLFDRQGYHQRTGTENEPSTGLGLYISKQLTEEMTGQLWFESKEHIGTTFYLSLDTYGS